MQLQIGRRAADHGEEHLQPHAALRRAILHCPSHGLARLQSTCRSPRGGLWGEGDRIEAPAQSTAGGRGIGCSGIGASIQPFLMKVSMSSESSIVANRLTCQASRLIFHQEKSQHNTPPPLRQRLKLDKFFCTPLVSFGWLRDEFSAILDFWRDWRGGYRAARRIQSASYLESRCHMHTSSEKTRRRRTRALGAPTASSR